MKSFIAYRFTGENPDELMPFLSAVRSALAQRDVDAYCSIFEEEQFLEDGLTALQIYQHAFQKLDTIDFLFVVITSPQRSEGMLMEVGYSFAKKIPLIVAHKRGVEGTVIPELAHTGIVWDTLEELIEKIGTFPFDTIRASS